MRLYGRHTGHSIAEESTLCKNYISPCYEDTVSRIEISTEDKSMFVSVDETSDAEVISVANIRVGILNVDGPGKILLVSTAFLGKE